MSDTTIPTPEVLRQLVDYDPETGVLTWRPRTAKQVAASHVDRWNRRWAGRQITTKDRHGYVYLRLKRRRVAAHRAAWAIAKGHWPAADIDHINGVRDDNRLANLRAVTRSGNNKNSTLRSDNKSGVVGVSWDSARNVWAVRIKVGDYYKFLGYFQSKAAAVRARQEASMLHGYHTNHGKRKGRPKPP